MSAGSSHPRRGRLAVSTVKGALGGAFAASITLAGVPVVLAVAVGWPVPPFARGSVSSARGVLDLLALSAWIVWLVCCVQLVHAIAQRVRRGDVSVDSTARITDRLAARAAAAVLVVLSVLSVGGQSAAMPPTPRSASSSSVTTHTVRGAHRAAPRSRGFDWAPIDAALLSFGAVVAAVLARRLRRTRRMRSLVRQHQPLCATEPRASTAGETDDEWADVRTAIGRLEGDRSLRLVETAMSRLPELAEHSFEFSDVRLLCANPAGVDLWVGDGSALLPLPPGSVWGSNGGWHHLTSAAVFAHPTGTVEMPALPVLLPVGEDARGAWFVPLHGGTCLSVLGPAAKALVTAMLLVAEGWEWSDHVLVTGDPSVASRELRELIAARAVLFVGDPGDLDEVARMHCRVVTFATTDEADLTLVVDRGAVTVHPLGRSVVPHLVADDLGEHLRRLLSPDGLECADASRSDLACPHEHVATMSAGTNHTEATSHVAMYEPERDVIVRLLTPVPRIDGLAEQLPNKRARRATELVAYLSLQRPHPVTTDRLRTRVLGNADVDAAAKTLFNTAAAARRALGCDARGEPLLPSAGRSGLYRVADDVRVDVLEIERLVRQASVEHDGTAQIELLRRALALVEGEPMAAVTGGYAWWTAEGFAARTSAVLVDAACHLASLATSAGLPVLAAWAIEKARAVEPFSEALARAAMRAAAAAGDADRLRREWDNCCRQVDDLDPGAMPSEETELLYGRLVRRAETPAVYANLPAIDPALRNTVPSAPAALKT